VQKEDALSDQIPELQHLLEVRIAKSKRKGDRRSAALG